MYVVYAIESLSTGRIYIGQTQDVEQRLQLHNNGHVKSTTGAIPWKLVAIEAFETREAARWCESQLKKSRGSRLKWLEQYKI